MLKGILSPFKGKGIAVDIGGLFIGLGMAFLTLLMWQGLLYVLRPGWWMWPINILFFASVVIGIIPMIYSECLRPHMPRFLAVFISIGLFFLIFGPMLGIVYKIFGLTSLFLL